MNTDKNTTAQHSNTIASEASTIGDERKPGASSSIIDARLWHPTTDDESVARVGDGHTLNDTHRLAELVYSASTLFSPDIVKKMCAYSNISDAECAQLIRIGRTDCLGERKDQIPDDTEIHHLMTFVSIPALADAINEGIHQRMWSLVSSWEQLDNPSPTMIPFSIDS